MWDSIVSDETGATRLMRRRTCLRICVCCFLMRCPPLPATDLDSSHSSVSSEAPDTHLYPCDEAYGECSEVRHNKRTFAVLKITLLQGGFSHLHSWEEEATLLP